MKLPLTLRSAFVLIAAAGTPQPLAAVSAAPTRGIDRGVVVLLARKSKTVANTGNVYIGDRAAQNLTLAPGGHVVLRPSCDRLIDFSEIFIDGAATGDGVMWLWVENDTFLEAALAGLTLGSLPAGTNTIGSTTIPGALTDRSGTITTGGTAQQVAAALSTRRYFLFQNHSDTDMWINFGVTAVADQPSILIKAGGSYENPAHFCPNALVSVICATTGKKFTAKEA